MINFCRNVTVLWNLELISCFFHNRLGVDVTYYRSDAYDLITKVALPVPSGYSFKFLNTGHVRNQGWEVVLSATPVKTKLFEWNANINWRVIGRK